MITQNLIDKFILESESRFAELQTFHLNQLSIINDQLNQYAGEINLPEFISGPLNAIYKGELQINVSLPSPVRIGYLESTILPQEKHITALYDYSNSGGLCFQINSENQNLAHHFFENIAIRIFASLRPDLIHPVIIDPEGKGSNFKILCALDPAKSNLLFTTSSIKEGLESVLEQFGKIQTDSLSYKYESLEEMNINEREMAKPYTFIFVSNFPAYFDAESCKLIKNIIQNGFKFGTFLFMTYNPEVQISTGSNDFLNDIFRNIGTIKEENKRFHFENCRESEVYNSYFKFFPEISNGSTLPSVVEFLNQQFKKNKSRSITQEAYFDEIFESKKTIWMEYRDSESKNNGIKAAIGLVSANDELEFTIDCDTSNYHAIIGGKTGSGKTVLIDNIIVNSALKYSPLELQFVLLDFKGASFQKYKNLPHLKILFSGGQRSYGLNVLRFIKDENTRRQEILADLTLDKIGALTQAQRIEFNFGRLIVILDEFQILLKERDEIFREASSIIDTIAQQGRSAGIHLILTSQDLTGVTISESTQSNSNLRIALEMETIPCQMIFSRENTDATKLSKKGEAIYNDKSGRPVHGNIKFQGYDLKDEVVKKLVRFLEVKFTNSGYTPIDKFILPNTNKAVFQPKRIHNELQERNTIQPSAIDIFIGEPSFIRLKKKTQKREDSFIRFKTADNANMLIAGNDCRTALSFTGLMAHQLNPLQDQENILNIYNGFGRDKNQVSKCLNLLSENYKNCKIISRQEIEDLFSGLVNELQRRKNLDDIESRRIITYIFGLDALFYKTGSSFPEITQQLISILRYGPQYGLHIVLYAYSAKTFNNSVGGFNGISTDLFETKIILKGDGTDIISSGLKQDPEKEGTFLLYAPQPITSVNPDLINCYSTVQQINDTNQNLVLKNILEIEEIL